MLERVILIRRTADDANAQDPNNREYTERGARALRKGVIDTAKEYGCPNIPRN